MKEKALIFFGAGSTFPLGSPITSVQEKFFGSLVSKDKSVKNRVEEFISKIRETYQFNTGESKRLTKDLADDLELTLSLLYDGDGAKTDSEAMNRHNKALKTIKDLFREHLDWKEQDLTKLEHFYNIYVFPYYDWLAFKSIAQELYNVSEKVSLQDMLSVLNASNFEGISLPTPELFSKDEPFVYLNYPQRLSGAINVYELLLFKLFKHLLRVRYPYTKNNHIDYVSFAKEVIKIDSSWEYDRINSSVSLATLNWDPILPFFFLRKVRDYNQYLIKDSKRMYLSYGAPFRIKYLNKSNDIPRYMIDEDAASYSNIMTHEKRKCSLTTKILKFFVPHGLMNMRACPHCHNVFLLFPDQVGKLEYKEFLDIFLLDPIPSRGDMERLLTKPYKGYNLKRNEESLTYPSQIECPYCKIPTFFNDSFLQIQSIMKPQEPPSMRKIYMDYTVSFSKATHLIFIGYSFPIDDIIHLLSLMILSIGTNKDKDKKFTLLFYEPDLCLDKWFTCEEAERALKSKNPDSLLIIQHVEKIAKKKNIRVNFCGFPQILHKIPVKSILNFQR